MENRMACGMHFGRCLARINARKALNELSGGFIVWAVLVACTSALADAPSLDAHHTPIGGERSGSKDGAIPPWQPEAQKSSGWAWGKPRKDFFVGKDDRALFSITADSVQRYAANLTPGQIALLKQNNGYQMDVYPSRRVCGVPEFYAENTRKNQGYAKVGADGWSLADAMVPSIPFPVPTNGVEAMLNMKLRYRGVGLEWKKAITAISPRKGGDDWIEALYEQTAFYPWAAKKSASKISDIGKTELYLYFSYKSPPSWAGQGLVGSNTFDAPGNATNYYFPGQRRVRRMPSYAYDAPQIGYENQFAVDEVNMLTGSLDRFDWRLVGKRDIYVPYNSFGMYDFTYPVNKALQKNFVAPQVRRYELHRVWVVEGMLKSGERHSATRRTYYLDEDSWGAVLAEDYDAQGAMWKIREGFLMPVFETGTCDLATTAQYNIKENRYVVDQHVIGTGVDVRWVVESNDPRFKPGFYTGENLRAISDR